MGIKRLDILRIAMDTARVYNRITDKEFIEREVRTMTAIAYILVFSILAFEAYPTIRAGFKK